MQQRHAEQLKQRIGLREEELVLLTTMYDKLYLPIEFLYFLIERGKENAFILMFIDTGKDAQKDVASLIRWNKRETDLFFPIDEQNGMYVLLCQGTHIEGGYRFAERLMKQVINENAQKSIFIELEVKTTKYNIKQILFQTLELYLRAKKENTTEKIVYKSLY